jgi:hypothetical protein
MACIVEYAELSRAAYFDKSLVEFDLKGTKASWTRTVPYLQGSFFAALYAKAGDVRVLAFRGTDDLIDAASDDVDIAFGSVPPRR